MQCIGAQSTEWSEMQVFQIPARVFPRGANTNKRTITPLIKLEQALDTSLHPLTQQTSRERSSLLRKWSAQYRTTSSSTNQKSKSSSRRRPSSRLAWLSRPRMWERLWLTNSSRWKKTSSATLRSRSKRTRAINSRLLHSAARRPPLTCRCSNSRGGWAL